MLVGAENVGMLVENGDPSKGAKLITIMYVRTTNYQLPTMRH